jgi:peptidoglycan/LPS O-acetylase OafA/YrhL
VSEGSVSHERFRSVRTFGSLDGLRCLSILAVVWQHSSTLPEWMLDVSFFRRGFLGVDLFFVISGFLIVTLLLREREHRGRVSLRKFYARRFLRIFPLYYGLLGAFALFYWLRPGGSGAAQFHRDLPFLLLYLTNWFEAGGMLAITWSLAAEEQFYLLWPPIERFLQRWALVCLALFLIASQLIQLGWIDGFLARTLGWAADEPSMLREATFTPICLGVLLAHALHHRASFDRVASLLGHRLASPLVLLALVIVCALAPADLRGWARPTLQGLMMLLIASCVVREDHGLARFLTLSAVARIGALSYGIYLLHHIGLGIANKALDTLGIDVAFGDLLLGFPITYALCELSYRFYETPFLRLKRRFA